MGQIVKSTVNKNYSTLPTIIYHSGSSICWREVEEEGVEYWTVGETFNKPEKVKKSYGLFLVSHPCERLGLVEEFKTAASAAKKAKKLYPYKTLYGYEVKWEVRQTR